MAKHTGKKSKFVITFTLEVEGAESEEAVEEAVTAVIDEELSAHSHGGTRCGVRFHDAVMFSAREDGE